MGEEFVCPLCGSESYCKKLTGMRNGYIELKCSTLNLEYALDDAIFYMRDEPEKKERLLDLTVEALLHRPLYEDKNGSLHWYFSYKPDRAVEHESFPNQINLVDLIGNYPKSLMDKVHRGLINLSLFYPNYGDIFEIDSKHRRLVFERENNSYGQSDISDFYEELGYFSKVGLSEKRYRISALGWQRIDEVRKKEQIIKQAFIAMQFGKDTSSIREAFRRAIRESGYTERLIDEKEHNHQIVPEIFYEIERSRFMVVDITFPNFGAYYEAGYAQALGKEVIICCKNDAFSSPEKTDRPHFDIAQKSMIVWNDEEELVERLKKRIAATVQ